MYKEILENNKDLNQRYVRRYLKFLLLCEKLNVNTFDKFEKHHILPESLYRQYKSLKKFKWNRANLTLRQHFISHWILSKIFGGTQWFSFNQMKRFGGTSILYEYGRKYIIEQIKTVNTGRLKTEKERKSISDRTKNTVVVKDKDNNRFRVSCDDERYLSGELVYYRTGTKHNKNTIDKMKSNNGIKGKKPFIENNKIVFYHEKIGVDMGLTMGFPKERNQKMASSISKLIWVTEIETHKHKRIEETKFDDKLYLLGRKGFHGFKHINSKRSNNETNT